MADGKSNTGQVVVITLLGVTVVGLVLYMVLKPSSASAATGGGVLGTGGVRQPVATQGGSGGTSQALQNAGIQVGANLANKLLNNLFGVKTTSANYNQLSGSQQQAVDAYLMQNYGLTGADLQANTDYMAQMQAQGLVDASGKFTVIDTAPTSTTPAYDPNANVGGTLPTDTTGSLTGVVGG